MSFESMGLAPFLLRVLAEQGYQTPTPIQQQAIPLALEGHDLLAGAQTGTGKTAAFGLPILQRLADHPQRGARRPRVLILTPTRELATQVHDNLRDYGKYQRVSSAVIYGGVGMGNQLDALRRGVELLVACPGRLIDHMERRSVDLSGIEVLVLDEADRMLDMGFLPSIKRILAKLPKQNRQTMLFSATFADPIKELALEFMHNPREVMVTPRNTVVETIAHHVHPVDAPRKRELLLHLLAQDSREQTLVFAKTKHGSDKLAKFLEQSGLKVAAIHGNKSQGQRQRALDDFKAGRVTVLVATDIAARGIDIDQLPKVINFELPMVAEDYIHRIGRTGRNGANGRAISLVSQDEAKYLRQIVRLLNRDMDIRDVPGFEPQTPIRWGNSAPGKAEQPGGQRPPRRAAAPRAGGNSDNARPGGNRDSRGGRRGERDNSRGDRDNSRGDRDSRSDGRDNHGNRDNAQNQRRGASPAAKTGKPRREGNAPRREGQAPDAQRRHRGGRHAGRPARSAGTR